MIPPSLHHGPDHTRTAARPSEYLDRIGSGPLLAVLFVVLSAIYANSFHGAFTFDDWFNIVENPGVHLESLDRKSLAGAMHGLRGRIERPLAYLSFGLNHYVHGLDVFGYHVVNFLIHVLTALALYLFILRILRLPLAGGGCADRDRTAAFLAVLLWSTSPIQVTAVTYIVQRMASMAALFFILAMLCWLLARTAARPCRKAGWLALCLLSGLLSLASKENAAMLPPALYLFDLLLVQGLTRNNLWRHLRLAAAPLALLAGAAFLLADPVQILSGGGYGERDFTMWQRLLTQPRVLLLYLSQMLYPIPERFALIHEIELSTSLLHPWTTLPAVGFWLGWLGLGLYLAGRRPLIAFSLLFFLVNHVVESSILPLELVFEHRNYLPSMPLYLLAALGIVALVRDCGFKPLVRYALVLAVVVTVVVQGHAVIRRNTLFADPLRLWADNMLKAPGTSRVHVNLGNELYARGMIDKAAQAYATALEVNRYHRRSLLAVPLNNLGTHHLLLGDVEQARAYYEQAIEADRGLIKARIGMVAVLLARKELDAARNFLEQSLEIAPHDLNLLTLRSLIRLKKGDLPGAICAARVVLRKHPVPSPVYKVLGETCRRLGDYTQARRYWVEYANAFPEDLEPGLALLQMADRLNNRELLGRAARRLAGAKGERSWQEVFELLDRLYRLNDLVIPGDPRDMVPLISKGIGGQGIKADLNEDSTHDAT